MFEILTLQNSIKSVWSVSVPNSTVIAKTVQQKTLQNRNLVRLQIFCGGPVIQPRFTEFYHMASCILKESSVTQNIKIPKSHSITAAFMSHIQTAFTLKTEK
jgi:hypothetical protein